MKSPKCGSTHIEKERWIDVDSNATSLAGSSAYNQTGDMICRDCKYASSPDSFKK